jgi:hypothetical protein
MNNLEKDKFIFDYLEGNLNESQKGLFEELVANDKEFGKEVEMWKSSFYNKDAPVYHFPAKKMLAPQMTWLKYFFLGSAVTVLGVLAYQKIQTSQKNEELTQQITQLKHELNNSVQSNSLGSELFTKDSDNEKFVLQNQYVKSTQKPNSKSPFASQDLSQISNQTTESLTFVEELIHVPDFTPVSGASTILSPTSTPEQNAQVPSLVNKTDSADNSEQSKNKTVTKQNTAKHKAPIVKWKDIQKAFKNQRVVPMK